MKHLIFTLSATISLIAFQAHAQNVGISDNIFTPRSFLHVHQPNSSGNLLQLTNFTSRNTGNNVGLVFSVIGDDWSMRNFQAGNLALQTGNGSMQFLTNNTEKMIILSGGNVGIGDMTPLAMFTVGSGDLFRVQSTGHVSTINASAGAPAYSFTGSTNTGMWSPGTNTMAFSTAGAERMRMHSNGQFSINTTTPYSGDVVTAIGNSAILAWVLNGYHTSIHGGGLYAENVNAANAYNAMEGITRYNTDAYTPSGVFGLAIATSGVARGVRGASNSCDGYGVYGTSTGRIPGALGAAGYFDWDVVAGDYWNMSDKNLKRNIQKYDKALSDVMKIEVHTYNYNNELLPNSDGRMRYGFIAQEIETVFPGLVKQKNIYQSGNNDAKTNEPDKLLGAFKVVNSIELIPILTKATQEQQEIIVSLEQRISELEKLVERMNQ